MITSNLYFSFYSGFEIVQPLGSMPSKTGHMYSHLSVSVTVHVDVSQSPRLMCT